MSACDVAVTGLDLKFLREEYKPLIRNLVAVHGAGHLSLQGSGLHLSIPCPSCLEIDGAKELGSKHLSVNIEKYFQRRNRKNESWKYCAYCHKESTTYSVDDLIRMPTLEARGYENKRRVTSQSDRYLVDDGRGNMVPPKPGTAVGLLDLSHDHPSHVYLRSRGLNIASLVHQFDCQWCVEEAPEDPAKNIYYTRLRQADWKNTPQRCSR